MSVWRQTGKEPAMLADAPCLPEGCGQLWADFLELHQCRAVTQSGPMMITFSDVDAWQRVNRVNLPAWQLSAIKRADMSYMVQEAKRKGGESG